jgi:hypothetical protein
LADNATAIYQQYAVVVVIMQRVLFVSHL